MGNYHPMPSKKTGKTYHHKIVGRLFISLLLGVSIFVVIFLFGIKILDFHFRNSDYLYRIETSRMYSFQTWVTDNNISSTDTQQLLTWMNKHNLFNMLIQKDNMFVFSNISGRNFSPAATIQLWDLLNYAERNSHQIFFSDGIASVFIYEGFEHKFYLLLLLSAGLLGILASVLILFPAQKKDIDRIHFLNIRLSDIGNGNLYTAFPVTGDDEIAYLASGIESMRISLLEKEQHEQEMKQAQQRLVLGMAHDLRTPLATLLTDLELLKRQATEADKQKYTERALIKTQEIRTLSDQLFEYFLASAEEPVLLEPWESAEYALGDYLSELYLYLSQEGFQICTGDLFPQEVNVRIHMEYMNRIINNIFSNIQKYADRQEPIFFSTKLTHGYLILSFRNKISTATYSSSTGIGVKNISLMMQKMNGKMEQFTDSNYYEIQLHFPIHSE